MLVKIFTLALMVIDALAGVVQGYYIISGSRKMVCLFGKWNMEAAGMGYFGSLIMVCVVFIIFPQTHIAGNFLMAAAILWIIRMQLSIKELKGIFPEGALLLVNLLLICLPYPI